MSNNAARRLAAMLTEAQRADVIQLAQAISAPADVPDPGTGTEPNAHMS